MGQLAQCPATAIWQKLTVEDHQEKFQSSSLIIGRPRRFQNFSAFQCLVEFPYRADASLKPRVVLYDESALQSESCRLDQYSVAAAFSLEYNMPAFVVRGFVCDMKTDRSCPAHNGFSAAQILSKNDDRWRLCRAPDCRLIRCIMIGRDGETPTPRFWTS